MTPLLWHKLNFSLELMTFTVRTQYTLITLFSGFETKPQDRYYKQ